MLNQSTEDSYTRCLRHVDIACLSRLPQCANVVWSDLDALLVRAIARERRENPHDGEAHTILNHILCRSNSSRASVVDPLVVARVGRCTLTGSFGEILGAKTTWGLA